jgi:hypothetical protein
VHVIAQRLMLRRELNVVALHEDSDFTAPKKRRRLEYGRRRFPRPAGRKRAS